MEPLKNWYLRKVEVLKEKMNIKELQYLISFYLQKKAEFGEYSIKNWNEEYKNYRKNNKLS